ncbi:MAG: FixH family protein [Phycisphaerae bacterium]|nr:FixH family protein [Phycisphaerae bacterium]
MIRRALQNRWAFVPVFILTLSGAVSATGVALALSVGDTAEPDYYRKGVAYDEFKEQMRRSGALGWVVTSELVSSTNDPRLARLKLAVADKYGIRIDAAQVDVEIVPIRDATQRVHLALIREDEGTYAADVPLRTGGQWEFRVHVSWKGKFYTDTFRRPVSFGPRKAHDA